MLCQQDSACWCCCRRAPSSRWLCSDFTTATVTRCARRHDAAESSVTSAPTATGDHRPADCVERPTVDITVGAESLLFWWRTSWHWFTARKRHLGSGRSAAAAAAAAMVAGTPQCCSCRASIAHPVMLYSSVDSNPIRPCLVKMCKPFYKFSDTIVQEVTTEPWN